MLELIAAAMVTAIATGVGAVPVFALGVPSRGLQAALLGSAAGAMAVAGVAGLLIPGIREGGAAPTLAGAVVGVVFMFAVRAEIDRAQIREHQGRAPRRSSSSSSWPTASQGFAIRTAYASETAGLGAFVVAAIIQNIPEGTSIAIPLAAAGLTHSPGGRRDSVEHPAADRRIDRLPGGGRDRQPSRPPSGSPVAR